MWRCMVRKHEHAGTTFPEHGPQSPGSKLDQGKLSEESQRHVLLQAAKWRVLPKDMDKDPNAMTCFYAVWGVGNFLEEVKPNLRGLSRWFCPGLPENRVPTCTHQFQWIMINHTVLRLPFGCYTQFFQTKADIYETSWKPTNTPFIVLEIFLYQKGSNTFETDHCLITATLHLLFVFGESFGSEIPRYP